MKNIVLAAALSLAFSTAFAGNVLDSEATDFEYEGTDLDVTTLELEGPYSDSVFFYSGIQGYNPWNEETGEGVSAFGWSHPPFTFNW